MTTPPLIVLAEGRRARPRKAGVPRPKEIVLHMQVADILRRFARPDWRWSHFPAGEHRDVRTASKLKGMGTQSGWPDFILISPAGQFHALELKRQGEALGDDQESFRDWCVAHGAPHAVTYSMDETLKVLNAWGVLRIMIGARK